MSEFDRIERVIRYLERNYLAQPSLPKLARVAGLSESHFHRMFSRWAGITPKEFLKFLTASHAKRLLAESRDLLNASLESGLSGPGRLHDLLVTVDAVTPGEFKAKGSGVTIQYGFHPTPFGRCLIAVTKRGVCFLSFLEGERRGGALVELKAAWPNARFSSDPKVTARSVQLIFGGGKGRLRVLLSGTPFQIKVWEALLKVPFGSVAAYADIARSVDSPRASRAVGSAVGRNSIAYLIPCHRVIREQGVVGEYRWGRPRKQALLVWEAARQRNDGRVR